MKILFMMLALQSLNLAIFAWIKTVGMLRKTRHRGTERVACMFTLGAAVYHLVGMRNQMEARS